MVILLTDSDTNLLNRTQSQADGCHHDGDGKLLCRKMMLFIIDRGPAHVFKNNAKTYEVI